MGRRCLSHGGEAFGDEMSLIVTLHRACIKCGARGAPREHRLRDYDRSGNEPGRLYSLGNIKKGIRRTLRYVCILRGMEGDLEC